LKLEVKNIFKYYNFKVVEDLIHLYKKGDQSSTTMEESLKGEGT